MKFTPWALLLLAALAATSASAHDIAGSWKVVFVSGCAWKSIGGAMVEFNVDGNTLTGTAHVGLWPGTSPISEGKIDGDRISFIVLGRRPSSDGFPKMRFMGTVHSDELQLSMALFYSYESDNGKADETNFRGKRIK